MRESLKWIVMFFFVISFVFGIVGCKEPMQVDTSVNYGSIKGKVLYSNENVNNHSGIQITLVSTDGLRTTEYSSSRGIATKARSVKDIRTSNISGEYSFENIPVGVYTIYASSNSSLEKAVATNIVVKGKQTVIANDLNLTATGSIKGCIVIDGSTNGTLGLDVFIAGTSFDGKVGIDGSFELTGIPAKTGYVLCVQKGTSTKIISENLEVRANVSRDIGETYLSSDDFETGAFNWRGSWDYFPENPNKYDAFFYTQDGCSYIFNGSAWDLLAQTGKGDSINWLGSFWAPDHIPYEIQYLDAYYNELDGCSYIWDGTQWVLLAKAGADGKNINWRGYYSSHDQISEPQELDVYFNTTDGCSYIFFGGSWQLFAREGKGINWRGYYSSHDQISEPQYLDAYYNTTDECSYIYNGWTWELLARSGSDGKGINWRGSFSSEDEIISPNHLDAYYNTTDGCSYIYKGWIWELLAHNGNGADGADGKGINWRGSHVSASYISDPQYLDAYYNTSDGCSYIYTANGWTLFAKAGADGADGADGKNIVWRGNFEDANLIENPQELDVYFNTTDGCSYIYTNNDWELLAQAGAAGKSIVWIGSYPNADDIEEPQLLWAFYNITDGCSYIYDGSTWQLLARKGTDGATGSGDGSIRWRGTFANANEVYEPAPLDAFFNKTDGCSYIYNGTNWVMLAQAGEDGKDGTDGTNGTNGKDGKGINWRGSYSTVNDISSPKYLDAYWNTTENCAYVYNGSKWTVLIKGPASGGTGSSSNTNIGSEVGANVVGTTLVSWDSTPASGVIRIPNGVTDIAEEVFYNNDKITRVIIPSTVVNIGIAAFDDCDNLTSVEFLGPGLEIIGRAAFYDCDNLVNITLPNTLKAIGHGAFMYCSKITTVNIPGSVVTISSDAYAYCSMLRNLTIGYGVAEIQANAFESCVALTSVTIPNSVVLIYGNVFYKCSSLSDLQISPSTWEHVGYYTGTVSNLTLSDLTKYDSQNLYQYSRVTE